MSAISNNAVQSFVKAAIYSKPIKNDAGALIFKYGNGIFYLGLVFLPVLLAVAYFNPPKHPIEGGLFFLLILVPIYMCVESKKYYLSFYNNSITRHTPWPWNKYNIFQSSEIMSIDYSDSSSYFIFKLINGKTIRASIMLNGILVLINTLSTENGITLKDNAKRTIEYYQNKIPNK